MFFDCVFKDVLVILLTVIVGIITYFKWSFKYWERKGLPSLDPKFPFGNMENPVSRKYSLGVLMKRYYEEFKARGCKHGGFYNFSSPVYIPIDPEYVKNIMQKDFQYFVDRGAYYNEKDDPLSAHLFALGGQKWRYLRTKLTPTFTSGKMKMMFDTLVQCADPMKAAVDNLCGNRDPVDIKDIVARYTTDIIGTCAFGVECNSFKNPDAELRKHGKNIFQPHSKFKTIKFIFGTAHPNIGHLLGLYLLPRVSTEFFFNVIKETVNFREQNNVVRKDMLQLLMELQREKTSEVNAQDQKPLTIKEVAAQSLLFFLAGFETSSTTMTFCLYELALQQDIQTRVRDEINSVLKKHNGEINYESIKEMKYLDQVIDETLRKYPAIPFLNRKCVKDYQVPNTNVTIEKGTLVFLSILGLQRDPEYFPEPDKFDPERFSEENKKKIRPFTYIPFGEGPRICIGLRFGLMQTKLGLLTLLKDFKFTINSKTEMPLKINAYSVFLSTDGCILLDVEKVL